jgi:hypothetical protein
VKEPATVDKLCTAFGHQPLGRHSCGIRCAEDVIRPIPVCRRAELSIGVSLFFEGGFFLRYTATPI